MSTAATSPASPGGAADETAPAPSPSAHQGIPFVRLVAVELRKLVDTRGGWIFHVVAVALVVGLVALASSLIGGDVPFDGARQVAQLPLTYLLPILGILIATGEWTHRSAMVTFALEPRRHRVITAKLLVTVIAALVYVLLSWALSAVMAAVAGPAQGAWETSAATLAGSAAVMVALTLGGFALGLVLMSRTLAIVAFFAIPIVLQILGAWKLAAPLVPWISVNDAYGPIATDPGLMTASEWQRAGVAFGIWVVVLTVVGYWLNSRREAK